MWQKSRIYPFPPPIMSAMKSCNTHSTNRVARLRTLWLASLMTLAACSLSQHKADVFAPEKPQPQAPVEQPIGNVTETKLAFFTLIKPLVEQENRQILADRKRLLELCAAVRLKKSDRDWLMQLAGRYGVDIKGESDAAAIKELLARVDTVPVDLALVQAANESAWGRSRFAKEANNYFGQWCYEKGCGIVPAERAQGATHEVRRFADAGASVRAYMLNLNTSRAYAEFRRLRQTARQSGQPADAELLALGLKSYSERGMEYVETIRAMIRTNRKLIEMS